MFKNAITKFRRMVNRPSEADLAENYEYRLEVEDIVLRLVANSRLAPRLVLWRPSDQTWMVSTAEKPGASASIFTIAQ